MVHQKFISFVGLLGGILLAIAILCGSVVFGLMGTSLLAYFIGYLVGFSDCKDGEEEGYWNNF